MSATTMPPRPDPYLAAQVVPQQALILDPEYKSIRLITPIARFAYVSLSRPKVVEQNGQKGDPQYSVTLLLDQYTVQQIYDAIVMVANTRWPAENRFDPVQQIQRPYTGQELLSLRKEDGGLHYPLREGDQMYNREPAKYEAFRGLFTLNCSVVAVNKNGQSNQPTAMDELGQPTDISRFYSGCYGRARITIYAFPAPGKQMPNRGIGISLQAVQFANHGDKLVSYDAIKDNANAFAAVGNLPVATPVDPGFGPNNAGPGSIPPTASGFAAAPPPPAGQPAVPGMAPVHIPPTAAPTAAPVQQQPAPVYPQPTAPAPAPQYQQPAPMAAPVYPPQQQPPAQPYAPPPQGYPQPTAPVPGAYPPAGARPPGQ